MEKLGVQPIQLLAQIFNFLILMVILKKYLYKPILKALEDRKKKIEDGLRFSEKAKQELEEAEKKKEEIVNHAKLEAAKIMAEAKKAGKKKELEIVEAAEKQAAEVIKKGKKDLEENKKQMEKQLEKETVDIATALVEKLLRQALSEADQNKILEKKLKDFARIAK